MYERAQFPIHSVHGEQPHDIFWVELQVARYLKFHCGFPWQLTLKFSCGEGSYVLRIAQAKFPEEAHRAGTNLMH